ncbi:MAG: 4Fe-4S binding protein [Deltaproteobacteria bacterium]|nr:4Fe-4S binding protein [Deltaproteobacteria bacterium]
MKVKRKIIEIDEERCDGCGLCIPACAEGAIEIVDGKARVVSDKFCDGLGACLGECPNDALRIVEREADEFDEEAVEAHLRSRGKTTPPELETLACGCPSTQIRTFASPGTCAEANELSSLPDSAVSALTHWPVQIRLIPPTAPFLKGADLLVTADCVPVAYPAFHRDFLRGKIVMLGCPKFDDVEDYLERFTEIFRSAEIKSVTVLEMEVPCCSALPRIVEKAMEKAGKEIPVKEIIITSEGKILERTYEQTTID